MKPKKIATSEELRYRNPKADPKLIQIEKKKVFCTYTNILWDVFLYSEELLL